MDIFVHFLLYSMLNTMYNTMNVYNLSNIYFILYCNMFYDHEAISNLKQCITTSLFFVTPVLESQRHLFRKILAES